MIKPITIRFTPEALETQIYEAVSTFLIREPSYALPAQQRHLTGLVLRKLLASSTPAVLNTLKTIRKRLLNLQDETPSEVSLEDVIGEEEMGSDYLEAASDTNNDDDEIIDQQLLAEELIELDSIIARAEQHLSEDGDDAKATALLDALKQGFAHMDEMDAPKKAIIFTESKRTALIDHFRDSADIMIATEAAAEGVNLQFCSLLINYDLPWNPQRVEQRIGRCHRYGQKFDVVVINFINESNAADKRVLELLTEKFQLFDGVFGSSDEILGKVEAGINIEKRIYDIYATCRTAEAIDAGFSQLQKECESAIKEKLHQTQEQLLKHFDEDIHSLLKTQLEAAEQRLGKISRWFWGLSQQVLGGYASFADDAYRFRLNQSPVNDAPVGNYQLIRQRDKQSLELLENSQLYRLSHPLGEWVIEQGKNAATPEAELVFDYSKHATKLSVIEPLVGQSGFLILSLLSVESVQCEQYLVFAALSDEGIAIDEETCRKLFQVQATQRATSHLAPEALDTQLQRRIEAQISCSIEANSQYFQDERDKLDRWAEDKVLAVEQALTDNKTMIKTLKREARQASNPEDQLKLQNELREAERKQRQLRRGIFDAQDEIEEKRDALIDQLEKRMRQTVTKDHLLSIRWSVV